MKNKLTIFLILMFTLFSTTAYTATFKGKVIDADTKEPIEGAVVVAAWHETAYVPPHGETRLKDVKEILTDKNGEWMIKGPKGVEPGIIIGTIQMIWSLLTGKYHTKPPEFIIFKPGYCSWPEGFGINACKEKIKPGGNYKVAKGETVELPRLKKREDRLRVLPGPISGHDDMDPEIVIRKQKEFFRLINEERRNLGLEEYRSYYEIFKEKK